MDMQIGVFCGVFSIIASLIVYAILSFYSIKEDSFDEAKANRRKLFKEYLDQRTNADKAKQKKTKKTTKKVKDKKVEQIAESDDKKEVLEVPKEVPQHQVKEPVDVPKKSENPTKSAKVKFQVTEKEDVTPVLVPTTVNETAAKKVSEKKAKSKPTEKKTEADPVQNTANNGAIQKEEEKKLKVDVKVEKKKSDSSNTSTSKKQNSGTDKQVINVNSIISLIQKAELSRSEVQLLIDTLLNSEDETSDWLKVKKLDSSRQDNCVKLRKQLSEIELSLKNEKQITLSLQGKLKELRSEMASDKSLATALKETVNKMQQEKDDLLYEKSDLSYKLKSTNDEKLELQEQLNKELAKAQQQKLDDDKHNETVVALKDEISDVTAQIETIESENASLKATISCLEGELNTHQNCQDKISGLERALNVLSEKLNEKESEISTSKKQFDSVSVTLNKFKKDNNALKLENEGLSEKVTTSNNELERLRAEVASLSDQITNEENGKDSNYQELLQEKENNLKQISKQLDSNMKNLNDLKEELSTSHEENNKLKFMLDRANSEMNDLKESIAKLKTQKSESENQVTNLKNNLNDSNSQITLLQEEVEKYKQKIKLNDGDLISKKFVNEENKNDSANGIDSKYDSLKLKLEEKESLLDQLTKQIENNVKTISDLKQELLDANKENDKLKVLLDKANSELTDLKESIGKLKAHNSENENLIVSLRSSVTASSNEIVSLKEEIEKHKQRNNELRNKNWKVVQALTDAEKALQNKLRSEETENGKHKKIEELQNNVNTFIQRLFPEIDIQEYKGQFNDWLLSVEKTVSSRKTKSCSEDLQSQNSHLQSLVANYRKIISETEQMLNELQSRAETQESEWQEERTLYQKQIESLRATQKTS